MTRSSLHRLLIVAAALFSQSCALLGQLVQKPNVTFNSVHLTSVSFEGIAANFVMDVQNPNPVGLDLARLAYQLTIDGHQLAAGQANQAASIPANGTGQVTMPLAIKFTDFVQSVQALFTKETLPYTINITPGFNTPIGIIDVPINHADTFPVPKLPNVSFGAVTMGAINLTGATVNLGINVANPNSFSLPLGNLGYKVALAGNSLLEGSASPGAVAAGQTAAIPITARVDFLKTGMGLMSALTGGNATISFDGLLDLGFYKHPIHLEQRISR